MIGFPSNENLRDDTLRCRNIVSNLYLLCVYHEPLHSRIQQTDRRGTFDTNKLISRHPISTYGNMNKMMSEFSLRTLLSLVLGRKGIEVAVEGKS